MITQSHRKIGKLRKNNTLNKNIIKPKNLKTGGNVKNKIDIYIFKKKKTLAVFKTRKLKWA